MSFKKFKEATLYVCSRCQAADLGSVKLNKILLYADFVAFVTQGETITGEKYVKRQYGPVPHRILRATSELQNENRLVVRKGSGPFQATEYFAKDRPRVDEEFTASQIKVLDEIIEWIALEHTAKSVSQMSHDAAWNLASYGEEITMQAMLAGPAMQPTPRDIAWAVSIVKEHKAAAI